MAKIHYDELTVGVPSKASSVNYENADGTKESVQSKISKIENDVGKSKQDIEGSQGRNLIPYPYYSKSGYSAKGVTFTTNSQGKIILNGTQTGTVDFLMYDERPADGSSGIYFEKDKTYVLSTSRNDLRVYVRFYNESKSAIKEFASKISGDTSVPFVVDFEYAYCSIFVHVANSSGYKPSWDNDIVSVMLEEGTASHAYEPTTESNVTLKQNIADLSEAIYDDTNMYTRLTSEYCDIVSSNYNKLEKIGNRYHLCASLTLKKAIAKSTAPYALLNLPTDISGYGIGSGVVNTGTSLACYVGGDALRITTPVDLVGGNGLFIDCWFS